MGDNATKTELRRGALRSRRRGRMRMIVVALLAGAAGVWWWSQPVLDPRIVGEWTAMNGSGDVVRRFSADGSCVTFLASTGELAPFGGPRRWRMEQGEIVVERPNRLLEDIRDSIKSLALRLRGIRVQIVHLNPGRLRLIESPHQELRLEEIRRPLPDGTPRTEVYVRRVRSE